MTIRYKIYIKNYKIKYNITYRLTKFSFLIDWKESLKSNAEQSSDPTYYSGNSYVTSN